MDEQRRTIEREHDWGQTEASFAITEAIADLEGESPGHLAQTLDTTLETAVDTEALNKLTRESNDIAVVFDYSGYRVQIDGSKLAISPYSL